MSMLLSRVMSDDKALKTAFAEALLRTDDPFKAAFSVIPDTGQAMQVASIWPSDAFVRAEQMRLLAEPGGTRLTLPTKEQQAKDLYSLASDKKLDEETRLKAHRLYAEIMGNIEQKNTTNNQVTVQAVLVVKEKATDDEWEAAAVVQQKQLTTINVEPTRQ